MKLSIVSYSHLSGSNRRLYRRYCFHHIIRLDWNFFYHQSEILHIWISSYGSFFKHYSYRSTAHCDDGLSCDLLQPLPSQPLRAFIMGLLTKLLLQPPFLQPSQVFLTILLQTYQMLLLHKMQRLLINLQHNLFLIWVHGRSDSSSSFVLWIHHLSLPCLTTIYGPNWCRVKLKIHGLH